MCRSLPPFRIATHSSCNSRIPGRRGTSPCTSRRESARRARGSSPRSCAAARSQSPPLPVFVVLWCANEHFDEVIVQGIVKLPLKTPLELRIIEIPRMQIEVVGMHRNALILELDDDFDAIALRVSGKVQKGMF